MMMGLVVAKKKAADTTSLPTTFACFFHRFFAVVIDYPEISHP
jgi:hypothetical protein